MTKKTAEAFKILCEKQEVNLSNPSALNMEAEVDAYRHWDHISGLEENFLKKRSKLHWLQIRDRNNKTFHKAAAVRNSKNTIKEIRRQDGAVVRASDEIKMRQ